LLPCGWIIAEVVDPLVHQFHQWPVHFYQLTHAHGPC
jgi:hypothetical protein